MRRGPVRDEVALVSEVWNQAQNVRIWLATAQDSMRAATAAGAGGFFARLLTRGRIRRAHVRDAVEAIGKAKLALIDLDFAQHCAHLDRIDLRIVHIDLSRGIEGKRVTALAQAIDDDIAALDALAAATEVLQRARR